MKKILTLLSTIFILSFINAPAMADDNSGECIIGQVNGMSLAEEFGEAVPAITRCLEKNNKINLVMQVNKACRDTGVKVSTNAEGATVAALDNHANSCGASRGYGIAQMKNMIKDWKITHDITADKLDLNIIVHGGGGTMLLDSSKAGYITNNLQDAVQALLDDGVKFHFCMNTVRGMAKKMQAGMRKKSGNPDLVFTSANLVSKVIPGVTYVTGGLTALSDFQSKGYTYIHP